MARRCASGVNGRVPLEQSALQASLAGKGGLLAAGKLEVLDTEDDFYYGHKRQVKFPVYRLSLNDPEATKAYFDFNTGELRQLADEPASVIAGLRPGTAWTSPSCAAARCGTSSCCCCWPL